MDRSENFWRAMKQKQWIKKAFEVTTSNAFLIHYEGDGGPPNQPGAKGLTNV